MFFETIVCSARASFYSFSRVFWYCPLSKQWCSCSDSKKYGDHRSLTIFETTTSFKGQPPCLSTVLSFTFSSCSLCLFHCVQQRVWWPTKLDHFMRPQPPQGSARVSFYSLSFHLWPTGCGQTWRWSGTYPAFYHLSTKHTYLATFPGNPLTCSLGSGFW